MDDEETVVNISAMATVVVVALINHHSPAAVSRLREILLTRSRRMRIESRVYIGIRVGRSKGFRTDRYTTIMDNTNRLSGKEKKTEQDVIRRAS